MSSNPYRDENGVLLNKLGFTDGVQLREVEYQLTRIRALELQLKPIEGNYDLAHLKAIHHHLFGDVYAWAGQERVINVSKKSLTEPGWKTVFVDKNDIPARAVQAHSAISEIRNKSNLDSSSFAAGLVNAFEKWNAVHPFPEGNGRALNTLFTQLARETGHSIDYRRVPGDFWLDAAETSLPRVKIDDPRQVRPADLADIREIFDYMVDAKPEQVIRLEAIKINVYPQTDRMNVQAAVISVVQNDPDWFIERYKLDERSFGGRYVAADLFKETFDEYASSKASRNRYNAPLHNAAAVLSAELFRQQLKEQGGSLGKEVMFLTGTPGSGKTSTVIVAGDLPASYRMVFEGQMANPITSIEKIQQVLDAGLQPSITVVHATPENALANTLRRFEEQGRGASINVMAQIQASLPDSLKEIQRQYGDAVKLHIIDVRDRMHVQTYSGWQHVELIRSEGNHEQIKQRLSSALEQARTSGALSDSAYRQAAGLGPLDRDIGLVSTRPEGARADVSRRADAQGHHQQAVVKEKNEGRYDRGR
jgi:fido (protein-threonine AMPylation protein)